MVYYIYYMLMLLVPFRQWTTQAAVTKQSKEPKGCTSKLCSKYGKQLSLVSALVSGVMLCIWYYYAFVGLEYAVKPFAGLYRSFDEAVPIYITSLVLPLLFFVLRANEALELSLPMFCTMYAYVSAITLAFGIVNTLLFLFTTVMSLVITFGKTSARLRYFYRIYATHFCSKTMTNLVSHFYGVLPPQWNGVLYVFIAAVYLLAAAYIYGKSEQTVRVGEDFHERFFQRGNVQAQIKYIKQQWHLFSFIVATATICSFGQFGPSFTHDASDTMGHAFCKVDRTKQLECRVNVTYFNPREFESEEDWTSNSTEWDFCGVLSF